MKWKIVVSENQMLSKDVVYKEIICWLIQKSISCVYSSSTSEKYSNPSNSKSLPVPFSSESVVRDDPEDCFNEFISYTCPKYFLLISARSSSTRSKFILIDSWSTSRTIILRVLGFILSSFSKNSNYSWEHSSISYFNWLCSIIRLII